MHIIILYYIIMCIYNILINNLFPFRTLRDLHPEYPNTQYFFVIHVMDQDLRAARKRGSDLLRAVVLERNRGGSRRALPHDHPTLLHLLLDMDAQSNLASES